MAEEFGKPYVAHRQYRSLPLNSAVTLWRDFATVPFELVFIERGHVAIHSEFLCHG